MINFSQILIFINICSADLKKEDITNILDILKRNNINDYIFYANGKRITGLSANNKDISFNVGKGKFKLKGIVYVFSDIETQLLKKDENIITNFNNFIRLYS